MRGTNRPAYLVVTDKNYTLDTLENTKFLLSTRCHRCQRWGHATANCHSRAKYVKCAGDHLARDQGCELGNKIKPKCVNCDGDHTANTICPEYQKKLEAAQESRNRSNTKSEKFVPAALLKVNVWEIRKNIGRNGSSSSVRGSTQATPSTSNTKAHSNTEAIPSSPNSQGSPSDLFAQIKTLNSLCNVSNLITALRDLNNLLSNAKSSEERFMTVLQFTQNITKSPISSQGDK
ncbi:hypothetical protein MTP99_004650 [Tenebrio molitor]|nr:hypothetical protein MTP99_004650 [Tenebrio molitor]